MTRTKKLDALTSMVEHILETVEESRNNDLTLLLCVWSTFHGSRVFDHNERKAIYLEDVRELPREDHVSRIRRKMQESGRFLPTRWDVAKQRGIEEDAWRMALGYPPKEPPQIIDIV